MLGNILWVLTFGWFLALMHILAGLLNVLFFWTIIAIPNVRTALQDAASIAGLLVTTEAMIADKPDDKDAGAGGMPGGMPGGMGAWGHGWNGYVIPLFLKKIQRPSF